MFRQWNGGSDIMGIYQYSDLDEDRMGNCNRLPKTGDLCVCVEHSGDCFYNFVVIRKTKSGTYKKKGKFSAYNFGKNIGKLKSKEFYLLMAGEEVKILIKNMA